MGGFLSGGVKRWSARRLTLAFLIVAASSSSATAQVVGPTWELAYIEGFRVTHGMSPIRLTFAPDGKFSGHDGCNHFGGEYVMEGRELHISELMETTVSCVIPRDPGQDGRSRAFLHLLAETKYFNLAGRHLQLSTDDGRMADLIVQP